MSELFCISREGSYSSTIYAYYIDSSIDNDQNEFSAYPVTGGSWRTFKKPVGVVYYNSGNDATYLSVYGYNITLQTLFWYEDSTKKTKSGGTDNSHAIGTSFGVQKTLTFGTAIPFFNNDDDASAYSRGAEYDASNWVGGKPLTPTPSYTWQSVPSISGKNGTVNLSRIKDDYINNGEPVSGAAKSRFNNLKDGSKVSVLIENVLPDPAASGTDVTVKYDVPSLSSGSYTYCKLVVKKNSMPESVEDGNKIINLDPTKASVTVKYLSGNTKYYFEIFTQDSEGHEAVSNVKSITTGEAIEIPFFTDSFNSDLMKNGWDLATFKSEFGNGSTMWAPTSFSSDFLSTYNFLIGNYNRDRMVEDNGILRNDSYNYGASDSIYWIPIERVNGELKGLEWDYCNLRAVYSSYDDIGIMIGWVDSSNEWHQATVAWISQLWSSEWQHGEYTDLSIENPYIDYIGIYTCDGQPACKNIKLII